MRFLTPLTLSLLRYSTGRPVMRDDVCLWYHQTPYRFEPEPGVVIEIPAFDPTGRPDAELRRIRCRGITDLASVPMPFRNLLPPNGGYVEAAIPHDDGYVSKGWDGRYSRKEVDRMLLDGMTLLGVPGWRRAAIYTAVSLGGWWSWGT